MRPTHMARVFLFGAAALTVIHVHNLLAAQARGSDKPPSSETTPATWSKAVVGRWMDTQDLALESALESARDEVQSYLNAQQPPFVWVPNTVQVREYLLRDLPRDEVNAEGVELRREQCNGHWVLVEEKNLHDPLVLMRRVYLKVSVSAKERDDLRHFDEQVRKDLRQTLVQHRQLWLGKILLGLVAILGALAGYFRLDEATKGYYTGWLRLGVLGVTGAVGMMLWLVC
jgi:hypothetical protein